MLTLALTFVTALLVPAPVQGAGACDKARTTAQIEACLQRELTQAERRLAGAESEVRRVLTGRALAGFDSASRAWRAYREAECRAAYDAAEGGSVAASSLLGCKVELTQARSRFVRKAFLPDK